MELFSSKFINFFAQNKKVQKVELQIYVPMRKRKIPDLEGGDFENLTISSQMEIARNHMEEGPFGLIGSSMGGYLAALLAQLREDVAAIYLMAPGFNFLERWQKKLKNSQVEGPLIPVFHYRYNKEVFLNTNLFIDAELWQSFSLEKNIPTKIVHGLHDDTVNIQESRDFVSSHPWCHLTELDSDHGLLSSIDWIIEDCINFFGKQSLI